MNPTPANRPHGKVLAGLSALALATLAACGGGGGGSSELTIQSTIFGYDPFTGSFDASGQQGQAPIIPQNMCLVFDFSASIAPASVNTSSIIVQEVDTSVSPPAPGPLAAVAFQVSGSRVIICPLVTFTDTNVTYGFNANKTYQVLFQTPPSTSVVTSREGRKISITDRGPYLFQTDTTIFDQIPGAPVPTMRLVDHATGATLSNAAAPFKPVPDVEITFNEPVLPTTAVDPGGVGTSPTIHIELDSDGDVNTTNDRSTLPGTFSLSQTSSAATVTWNSVLTEIPTGQPSGCVYVVTVDPFVQDLSGNSKFTETNDPNASDTFTFVTIPGSSNSSADPLVEPFDVQNNSDGAVTSAKWGTAFPGFLTAGVGGGTGIDGAFDPSSSTFQANPPADITLNVPGKTVTLGTDHLLSGVQRVYEFTSFIIPSGWTALASGQFPLEIQCSGSVTFNGTLDISGAAGAVYTGGQVGPGTGGAAALGGAFGGKGGSTTDASGVDTFFPGKVGATTTYPQLAFTTPVSGNPNQGASGRNTVFSSFSLTDGFFASNLNSLTSTKLWIQPNIGADDFRFERWHPAFRVTGISGGAVTVESSTSSADYRGPMDQETSNPYLEDDGAGGLRAPLLAEQYDTYVIGELQGEAGGSLFDLDLDGNVDNFAFFTSGTGSDAQSVMQTFFTLGRSGGGGGGGGVDVGANGDDDPTIANGPGTFGGTGTAGGIGGTAAPTSTFLSKIDSDTLRTGTNLFDDGTGNPDSRFVGHLINPNTAQGNVFVIASVDDVDQVTVLPITTSSGATIDLDDTILTLGHTVRVTPPYVAGGTGGGGAGVHCAGSSKNPAGHKGHPPLADNAAGSRAGFYDDDGNDTATQDGKEDTSESIFALPHWVPGAGGGAGGGAARFVAAGNISIAATGQILAEGGEGGRSDVTGATAASGGGGGAGGSIFLGAGGTLSVSVGGIISTAGGVGGGQGFGLAGGAGADGRIRLENALGNLSPANFAGATTPAVTAENLGIFPGGGKSLAQSKFLSSGVLFPLFQKVTVTFRVLEDGILLNNATYIVNRDGTVDPSSTLSVVPFDLFLSFTTADPATGLEDPNNISAFADPTQSGSEMSNFDGFSFIRFKVLMPDASVPFIIAGKAYTDLRIDSIQFDLDGGKP